jgi:hypothetical protein
VNNPLQPIQDAKAAIERRQKQREAFQMEFRSTAAAEVIAAPKASR